MLYISNKTMLAWACIATASLLILFQSLGISKDYENYMIFFDYIRHYGLQGIYNYRFEPLFTIFVHYLSSITDSNITLYTLLVIFSLSIKLSVINNFTRSYSDTLLIFLFYFVCFFPLWEMTQLRVAMASSFVMLSFLYKEKSRNFLYWLCLITAGFLHYSAFIFPLIIYRPEKLRRIFIIIDIIIITLIFLYSEKLTTQMSMVFSVIHTYTKEAPRWASVPVLFTMIVTLYAITCWQKSTNLMKNTLGAQVIGVFIFYACAHQVVMGVRLHEFILVLWVFYIADALKSDFSMRILTLGFMAVYMMYSIYAFSGTGFFV